MSMSDTSDGVDQQESMRERLDTGLDRLITVSADRVFREPVRVGETVVVPAAAIAYGGGFGFGGDNRNNGGGGGGGWNDGRPVAVIEAGPSGVRVRPVVDFTRIGLTVVAAAITVWSAGRRR
jgi:uncharacterized spore protein YtfJ